MGATASAQGGAWGPRQRCARGSIVEGVLETPSRAAAQPTRAVCVVRSAERFLSHSDSCALGAEHTLPLLLLPGNGSRPLSVPPYNGAQVWRTLTLPYIHRHMTHGHPLG